MNSIQPQGENLRRAVKWISEQRETNPDESMIAIAEKAAIQFDLSPEDSEFLIRFTNNADKI